MSDDYSGAFIQRPDGSFLYFDLTDEEEHSGASDITKFPVEDGPDITDHVRPLQTPLTIRCTISNAPLVPSGNQPGTGPGAFSDKTLLGSTVTLDISPYQPPLGTTVAKALINPVGSVISAVSGIGAPTSVDLPVVSFDDEFDTNVDTLFTLEAMRLASELLSVTTSTGVYENMVIEKYTLVRNAGTGTGSDVDITFSPVLIVSSKSVPTPNMKVVAQTAVKKKGPQGPQAAQPPKSSVSKAGLNAAGLTDAGSGVVAQ